MNLTCPGTSQPGRRIMRFLPALFNEFSNYTFASNSRIPRARNSANPWKRFANIFLREFSSCVGTVLEAGPGPAFANTRVSLRREPIYSVAFDGDANEVQTERREQKTGKQDGEIAPYLCRDRRRNCCWLGPPRISKANSCRDRDQ